MDKTKVLLVDDDLPILDTLKRVLAREGIEVTATSTPAEALQLLGQESFAVVMSDFRMPGMDGATLLEKAQDISPDTVRLILTGHTDTELAMEAINRGHVYRFLIKPWDNEELRIALRQAIASYALATENSRLLRLTEQQNIELKEWNQILENKVLERTRELLEAKEMAEIANRVKTEFLANVGHELRTPMNVIMVLTDLLLDQVKEPSANQFIQRIKDSSRDLLLLIDDILEVAQLEAQDRILEMADFSLRECLDIVRYQILPQIEAKGLELIWETQPEIPNNLVGSQRALSRLLAKLLDNAVKFTEAGQIILRVSLADKEEDAVRLHFAISDTGTGIPREQQGTIFEAFVQADGSTTRLHEGVGLGLTIASKLVQLMGGDMELRSEPEEGTHLSFEVRFKRSGYDR
ncbi:MAG: ATP-binding protein [Candidatus Tectomicrobia bacterium]|nr:ATP-binding protein [Candidatus Tectomicrobia bacterium]